MDLVRRSLPRPDYEESTVIAALEPDKPGLSTPRAGLEHLLVGCATSADEIEVAKVIAGVAIGCLFHRP
jgi:hypothetical protein